MISRLTRLAGSANALLVRQPAGVSSGSLLKAQKFAFSSSPASLFTRSAGVQNGLGTSTRTSAGSNVSWPESQQHENQQETTEELEQFTQQTGGIETGISPLVLSSEALVKRRFRYTKPADITPLKEASALYATIHMYDRKFLVTEGDNILLPVSLSEAKVGDVLNFDQVSVIGSRDYTLTGNPRIDSNVFSIKGVVVESTRVKRSVFSKSKRRRRHVRHVVAKNALTVIRISELRVNQDYGSTKG
ncbi:mitochondrial 54S ribosomal protein YmL49 [Sugiyamaella lignohabitans]|uniref:Large ribosomal subunit protein bL21m n=1 Tax=Sugiyamaella lignohabitans TaxID=796027 RepID=A0A167DG30_9ASCO|nr:mitochondrial 54S ribosomal protein YmL49 [Sugiyamaella lignohabitans]ANB12879.1 mitochondrial 54S ribosomal protein YmL49 [Sugiyamaella lignohabitans]